MMPHEGTQKTEGQRAHVQYNAQICNFDEAFIMNHLTLMEVPLAGMMIKIYLRVKIGSELH